MTEDTSGGSRTATVAAVICAACLGLAAWGIFNLRDGNAEILRTLAKPHSAWVQTFHVVWTDMNGDPCDCTVTGEPGEAPAQTAARFEAAVRELQIVHPKRR